MIVIVIVSVVVSLIAFRLIHGFRVACLVSTVVSSFLSWLLLQNHFGWFDKTFYENAFMTLLFAFATSFAVGALLKRKSAKPKGQSETTKPPPPAAGG